jgi:hypothetical protein
MDLLTDPLFGTAKLAAAGSSKSAGPIRCAMATAQLVGKMAEPLSSGFGGCVAALPVLG